MISNNLATMKKLFENLRSVATNDMQLVARPFTIRKHNYIIVVCNLGK